jgi:peptidoglycan/LPS O-acetylase OafA/YrhL
MRARTPYVDEVPANRGRRLKIVFGLQAFGVALWVLSQSWPLFDFTDLEWVAPLDGIFRSGRAGVSMLLAATGFLLTVRLMRARSHGSGLVGALASHVFVTSIVLAFVVAAVFLVIRVDTSDQGSWAQFRDSLLPILTFQWNYWVLSNPLNVRADLTPLWFFSVQMQLVLVLAGAVVVLGRWRFLLVLGSVAAIGFAVVWRHETLDTEGWFEVALNTTGSGDAFFVGVLAALVTPWVRLRPAVAAGWVGGAVLVLVGVVIAGSFMDVTELFEIQAPLAALLCGIAFVGASQAPDDRAMAVTVLCRRDIGAFGAAWTSVAAWSPVVILTVTRHTATQPQLLRVILAAIALGFVAAASERASRQIMDWTGDRLRRSRSRV